MKRRQGEKLYIQVFRKIRSLIISNNLQPGDLLPTEQALCESLGVSRNVLREAIKSMELIGLVSAQPGRGTTLQAFNLDFVFQNVIFASANNELKTIQEMLGIRKRLELGFMRQAYSSLQEEDIRYIRSIMERIKEKWELNKEYFHAEDREFHMALFKNLNNSTLLSLLDAIWSVDESFKVEEKVKHLADTIVKHENIIKALEVRNPEAFEAAMLAHFASSKYSNSESFSEY